MVYPSVFVTSVFVIYSSEITDLFIQMFSGKVLSLLIAAYISERVFPDVPSYLLVATPLSANKSTDSVGAYKSAPYQFIFEPVIC